MKWFSRISAIGGAFAWALITVSASSYAQSSGDRVNDLERKLDQSLKIINELSGRLKQLEAAAPKKEDVSKQTERIESVEKQVTQINAANASRSSDSSGLPMHGFADVGAGTTTNGRKGFSVGSLDFYLNPQLGARTKSLIELNFEVDNEGKVGVDLERLQLGYTFSDSATAWVGRFHTPYGYYNTGFHHGQQIATAIRRPRFLEFEDKGGILPAHMVGTWLTGALPAGSGKFTYDLFGGNSARIVGNTLDMAQAGITNHNLATGANLGYAFGGSLDGLKLGGNYLRARVGDDQAAANTTQMSAWGAYMLYDTDRWEHIAEIYRFNNNDVSGGTGNHNSTAGFVQLAYRAGAWTPYARYERTTLDQTDNYFAQQTSGRSYKREALGMRYDLDLKSALKLELAQTRYTDRDQTVFSEALFQYSIRF